jgi:(R,R)-butanediol dehydrogenase/meso-butanediol dehydrogenase/diacetyl reductase
MKAAVWYGRDDLRIENVPDPTPPGPGELILKVEACGICGTDLEEYRHGPIFVPVAAPNPLTGCAAPIILGHEFVGQVVAIGQGVKRFQVGDRAAPDVLIYCGECYWCQRHQVTLCENLSALGLTCDGGLAEYCKVPEAMCFPVDLAVPPEYIALAEPLSVAVRALRKGRLGLGETVAVMGAGTIGLFALQAALHGGAGEVIVVEPLAWRRELALQLGASAVIDPHADDPVEALRDLTRIGPDVVIEASGSATVIPIAIDAARKAGRIVLVGIPVRASSLNFFRVVSTEKEIIGSLSHVYDEDYRYAVRLLEQGRIQAAPLISDIIPLDDLLERGIHRLEKQADTTLKVLVRPGE